MQSWRDEVVDVLVFGFAVLKKKVEKAFFIADYL
jgi:hypothetical protein